MPVNPLRTVFVRLNTSAHPFPRLHARSFSKAVHVWVGCGWRGVGDRILYSRKDEKKLRENVFLCTEANRVTSSRPSCIKFGDKIDCSCKYVDMDLDLSARWAYLNSQIAQVRFIFSDSLDVRFLVKVALQEELFSSWNLRCRQPQRVTSRRIIH